MRKRRLKRSRVGLGGKNMEHFNRASTKMPGFTYDTGFIPGFGLGISNEHLSSPNTYPKEDTDKILKVRGISRDNVDLKGFTFGERMRNRRLDLNMSVDALADKSGVNKATIYRHESGDVDSVTLTFVESIAEALNVYPSTLAGWTESLDVRDVTVGMGMSMGGMGTGDISKLVNHNRDVLERSIYNTEFNKLISRVPAEFVWDLDRLQSKIKNADRDDVMGIIDSFVVESGISYDEFFNTFISQFKSCSYNSMSLWHFLPESEQEVIRKHLDTNYDFLKSFEKLSNSISLVVGYMTVYGDDNHRVEGYELFDNSNDLAFELDEMVYRDSLNNPKSIAGAFTEAVHRGILAKVGLPELMPVVE